MAATRLIIGNKNYSSWSLRGWLMATKSGVAFEECRLSLDTPQFAIKIKKLSPSGRVPVLHMDGLVVWDSMAIGEYLAERFPDAALLPRDPARRALMRSVCAEMHAGFAALRATLPMNCRASGRRILLDAATRDDIERVCAIWRDCLSRRDLPGGLFGGFTLADAMYAPVALRFATYGIELDSVCQGYVDWIRRDNDVRDWVRDARNETDVIEREEVGQ